MLTIGPPTIVDMQLRENVVWAVNDRINNSGGASLIRYRIGSTALVEWPLNLTEPLTMGGVDGIGQFNPINVNAVAIGGAAQIPDNYQVIAEGGQILLAGVVTGGDAITLGQTVVWNPSTVTMPASA